MNADTAKKIADQALTTLTDALAQGKSQTLLQYLAMIAKFPQYSFRNICLIAMQRPQATQVAGFSAWKQLGRYVKAGEKGIVIVAPMLIKAKEKDAVHQETSETDTSKPVMRFRGVYVFDVAQTEGAALPALATIGGDPGDALARLQSAIRSRGIKLDHEDVPYGCDGVSRGGHISIRPGMAPAEEFSVTVHELAHELLHRRDAADAADAQTPRPSKTVRETEAEAVAYVVSSAIGLEVGDAAKDYIQLYNGDAKMLIASMEAVQQAASQIINAIMPQEEEASHAA